MSAAASARPPATAPAHPPSPSGGPPLVACNAEAVRGADVVIAVTTGADSLTACEESRPNLRPGALYADLSTSAPGDKLRFAAFAGRYGMDVTPIGGSPGDAAARKLPRSVLVKGLSALVIESRRAAEAAGLGEWFWEHLLETVSAADERFVVRLLEGAGQHSVRRVHEMHAATWMLESLGVPHAMTATLEEVTRTGVPPSPGRPCWRPASRWSPRRWRPASRWSPRRWWSVGRWSPR
ncbi:DUF1932 domain-containing protein [Nonomuraea sp. NPDC003707]